MSLKTQVRDQSLHFGIGLVATLLLALFLPIWAAGLAVMTGAVGREIWQRVEKGNKWYACGWGCRLDLLFWALGIGLAVGLKVFEII